MRNEQPSAAMTSSLNCTRLRKDSAKRKMKHTSNRVFEIEPR